MIDKKEHIQDLAEMQSKSFGFLDVDRIAESSNTDKSYVLDVLKSHDKLKNLKMLVKG